MDGVTAATLIGKRPEEVYKTLVTRGAGGGIYVFVIPVAEELDLKKAAKAVKEKSVAMIPVREINAITGYVRGGCSPIGMKKTFKTFIHETAEPLDKMFVSAGKVGFQVELSPQDLAKTVGCGFADIV